MSGISSGSAPGIGPALCECPVLWVLLDALTDSTTRRRVNEKGETRRSRHGWEHTGFEPPSPSHSLEDRPHSEVRSTGIRPLMLGSYQEWCSQILILGRRGA